MFCRNCGSNILDGSNFCSVCGARIETEEAPRMEIPAYREKKAEMKSPSISFDWSNVREESHKKEVPEVHSPWGTTGLSNNELFEVEKIEPSNDKSRTMSFIDILKQERESKFQEEEQLLQSKATQQEDTASFYVPPLYDLNEETHEETHEETPRHLSKSANLEDTIVDENFYDGPSTFEELINGSSKHDAENLEYETAEFEKATMAGQASQEVIKDLESELAEILTSASGEEKKEEIAEAPENLYRKPILSDTIFKPVEEPTVGDIDWNEYLNSPIDQDYIPRKEKKEEPQSEEGNQNAGFVTEPRRLPVIETEFSKVASAEPVQAMETTPTIDVESEESEIDSLKRRLAELMVDEKEEEDVAEEPVVEKAQEQPAYLEIELASDEPEKEETQPVFQEITPAETQVETQVESQPEPSDAISVDELEKDLFGDVDDDEAEPEATKKIDKFYTLYKKNEEFQRLLDEEYNKLKTEDSVPHVDDVLAAKPVEEAETAEQSEPVKVTSEEPVSVPKVADKAAEKAAEKAAAKEAAKEAKAAEKAAKAELKAAAKSEGGSKLTVVAVIIAALLVVVLAVILILYCAPDSMIAWKIDSIIETIVSYFSVVSPIKNTFLM